MHKSINIYKASVALVLVLLLSYVVAPYIDDRHWYGAKINTNTLMESANMTKAQALEYMQYDKRTYSIGRSINPVVVGSSTNFKNIATSFAGFFANDD